MPAFCDPASGKRMGYIVSSQGGDWLEALAKDDIWSDSSKLQKKVVKAGFGDLWNAPSSFEFPEVQKLTAIQYDGSNLRLTWHHGQSWLVRDTSKDYTEEIEGDEYEFHAYRRRAERAVMRFEVALPLRLAGDLHPNSEGRSRA